MLATRKWIALTVGGLVLIAAFGALSWWQWQRAQRDQVDPPVVAATDVFRGTEQMRAEDYGARVRVIGTYDAAHQVLVAHGTSGFWIVTPLRPAGGIAVAVARGDVASPTDPAVADVTPGEVTVVGVAQPFEGDPGTPSTLPAGQIERLTQAGLGAALRRGPGLDRAGVADARPDGGERAGGAPGGRRGERAAEAAERVVRRAVAGVRRFRHLLLVADAARRHARRGRTGTPGGGAPGP